MIFYCKQFQISQAKSAMKISTDSLLLGSWAVIPKNCNSALDIGSGTGIISLMLAQKTNNCQIDAIEMDKNSYEESCDNFKNSCWSNRLSCFQTSWQDFVQLDSQKKYDLIISNPPFYSENLPTNHSAKHVAKFQSSLPFDELIFGVSKFLSNDGFFCLIIPYKEKTKFIQLAENQNLFVIKNTDVKGNEFVDFKRSLLAFSKNKSTYEIDELILETKRNQYTEKYKNLTKEFYLNL